MRPVKIDGLKIKVSFVLESDSEQLLPELNSITSTELIFADEIEDSSLKGVVEFSFMRRQIEKNMKAKILNVGDGGQNLLAIEFKNIKEQREFEEFLQISGRR